MNPEVDAFLDKNDQWREELTQLRRIALDCGLSEELKWKNPCYGFQSSNILILGRFKNYCAMSFIKGALLKDEDSVLEKPGENSQSARLIKFTSVEEVFDLESVLKSYIFEAIEVEKAGQKVAFKEVKEFDIPEELQEKLEEDPAFKTAFYDLTPGRQRGYLLYFNAPKQSKTKTSRIEAYREKILQGKGFHDCTCGLSKRMPRCDGSHKYA